MVVLALLACAPGELPDGRVVEEAFLRDASPIRAPLAVPCADATGGHGGYRVEVDDRSGYTALLDLDGRRVWLRDPFGVVPDRCWWLPLEGADGELADQPCAPGGNQLGDCGPDADVPVHWRWATPGAVAAGATDLAGIDGTLLLAEGDTLGRIDLTATADPPVDAGESPATRLARLSSLEGARGATAIAAGDTRVAVYAEEGGIAFYRRTDARRSLDEPEARSGARRGVLGAAGDTFAVVGADGIDVWDADLDRSRRDHRALRGGARGVAVDPDAGTPYALVADGVVAVGEDGATGFWPVPGAEGLFLGRPAGVPTVYAWGNDADGGVVWRLEPDGTATAAHTGPRLLGAGTGAYFQEIVLVEDGDPPVARGVLDARHADAIAPGSVGVALAAFVESPKDPDLADSGAATSELAPLGGCASTPTEGFEREHAVCCAQGARGERLGAQLAWLDARLRGERPMAVVIGVSPTAIAASRRCAAVDDPSVAAFADAVPSALDTWLTRWEDRGVASAAVFVHSAPFEPASWWVGCPDLWPAEAAPSACWDRPRTAEGYRTFHDELVAHASLAAWGGAPDWRLVAGGFGTEVPGVIGWPDVLPSLVLPDGAPAEDGLFFGNLGMDPRAPAALAKELSPDDAVARAFPVPVHTPADRWDGGGTATGAVYWPGQTFALEYLAEQRRSGLLMQEYIQHVSLGAPWDDPRFEGDEAADVITAADVAVAEHLLTARVLAARDVDGARFWTIHLGDLSRLRDRSLTDGWAACRDAACEDTVIDDLAGDLAAWPALAWRPTP